MFEPHPAFGAPADPDTPIWRYMDFARFVELLERRALNFTRLGLFTDKFEGALSPATFPVMERYYRRMGWLDAEHPERWKVLAQENYLLNQLFLYANCWHMNRHESAAMWDLYSGKGIAVRSTYARLRDCTAHVAEPVNIGTVRYLDYRQEPINFGFTVNSALSKRPSFAHEQELRAVVSRIPAGLVPAGMRADPDEYARAQPPTVYVPVDLDTLVDRVYVAPGSRDWVKDLVRGVVERYDLDKAVETLSLDERPDLV